jgi:CzcA family heavy metal efflux pump
MLATIALPVSLFPHINFPLIRVDIDAGDRPAERMEVEVTQVLEETLRGIPGVRTVRSTTSRGSAEIWLTFDWGQDMTSAYLQAQAQLARVLPSLPAGSTFEVRRMDPTVFPVIAYSITSQTRPLTDLRDLAQYQLRPILSTVAGVASIGVDGGAVSEYQVILNPQRMAEHDLAVNDVTTALSAANVLSAVGHIEDHFKLYLIVADAQMTTAADIGQTVLRAGSGGVTRLSDVAQIDAGTAPQFISSTADGRDCVLLNVYQQPGGNTVDIAANIRSALANEEKRLPRDVTISCWYDQSNLITASAHSVRDAVLIGVALAGIVLLLFLRNWRMTLIAALAVPAVLGITALVLDLLNQSFNIMTLGGMAAAVGLIIDDAIVISEHIVRRLEERPASAASASEPLDAQTRVLNATDEFTKPLAGSSLSTIVINIPPVFLVGVFGAFFAALSISMATSLVISFFVAWLVIPVLAVRVLRGVRSDSRQGAIARRFEGGYARLMRALLPRPWLALLIILPLVAGGYLAYRHVQSGVMPVIDEGGFVMDYVGPPGASISEMNRLLNRVEHILQQTPEVLTYSRRTGFSLGGDITESNTGDFFIRLKPLPRRPIEQVMDDVRHQIEQHVVGLEVEPAQLMEDLLGDLTGKPQPVVVNLYGDDEALLTNLAGKVADALGKVDGISSVDSGVVPAGDAVEIHIDRAAAALQGLNPDAVGNELSGLLSGNVVTQLQQGTKLQGVRVWIPRDLRRTTEDLGRLNLRAPDGHLVPLGRVAAFSLLPGQPEIQRENLHRVVSVTARSSRDLGSTIRDVRSLLDQSGLIPPGVRYTLGGQYEEQQAALRGVVKVIAAAASLVFLLLLLLYERLRVAAAILFISVLTISTVFLGLKLTGTELNISSMMGMVMIVGNVTEIAIFYYSEYADLSTTMRTSTVTIRNERLIAAGNHRMRAIAMTTIAAILALLPLALAIGQGAGMLQPLAIVIITGLIFQLPLVLIFLPALLVLLRLDSGVRDVPGAA